MSDNLSAVLYGKGDFRLEQRPIPEPKSNEVQIRIAAVGICGSDISYLVKGCIGDRVITSDAPRILGHEAAGVVTKIGRDVTNLKIGDRIAIEPGRFCRVCEFCKAGRYNLCSDSTTVHGSLTRYCTQVVDMCYKLPNHVSFEEGGLLEPLAVAVQACRRAQVFLGSTVLISGAGAIGFFCMLVAKSMGASNILITDMKESRLETAKTLGADFGVLVGDPNDELKIPEMIQKLAGSLADISIECSGAQSGIRLAVLCTKSGGNVSIVGLGAPDVSVPIVKAAVREIDIRGVFRYDAHCYPIALELIASGRINVKPLITNRYKLEETFEAFETARIGPPGTIKVVINC